MPLDDALAFIGRNFDRYIQDMRERRERGPSTGPKSRRSISPSQIPPPASSMDLTLPQLLNLLAEGRQLTVPEIDRVVDFLQRMRETLGREAGVPPTAGKFKFSCQKYSNVWFLILRAMYNPDEGHLYSMIFKLSPSTLCSTRSCSGPRILSHVN